MNKKKLSYLLLIIVTIGLTSLGFIGKSDSDKGRLSKPTVNDNFNYIAINQILMWVSNNGDGSHDPRTGGNGFYWPGGKNATTKNSAIFEDGLIWAGKIGREIRMNGNTHRQGLQAGKILYPGKADDPSLAKYRVYKIRKGWESLPPGPERDAYEKDYNEWPVADGAPWVDVNGDGVYTKGIDTPQFVGDEVLWYVANDLDPTRATRTYGSVPIGLEFQTTIFGFNRTGPLGDMVFKKYKTINKSDNIVDSMYFGYWSDTDLGFATDDYTGCDTILSLGYTYNADNNDDGFYGTPPPAVGYDFFQGPVIPYDPIKYPIIIEKNLPDSAKFDGKWIKGKTNLPMTAFPIYVNPHSIFRDPSQGVYSGTLEFYNYLNGLIWNGNPFINPHTGLPTKFVVPGDPVKGTGWYEGPGWPGGPPPGDRRHVMCTGPFTMAPGDTQEIVVGILIARGTSNINSIAALKRVDLAAQKAYDLDFNLTPPPPQPKVTAVGYDNKVVFYWGDNAESYEGKDPLIFGFGYPDTTYNFEGYEIYQYRDLAGTDPVLLATYDLVNGITKILDYVDVQGENVLLPVASGSNSGLFRVYDLTTDTYTQKILRNGSPYYIGVVVYAYSEYSAPNVLKSTHSPIEVFPSRPSITTEYTYTSGSLIDAKQIAGKSDGFIIVKVVDPDKLTGDKYSVKFGKQGTTLVWDLINVTKNDTLLRNQSAILSLTDLTEDNEKIVINKIPKNNNVVDGFIIGVADPGAGTNQLREVSVVMEDNKSVEPSGKLAVFVPRLGENIFNKTTKRGWWIASIKSDVSSLQNLNIGKAAGINEYELRFTSDSSEFYVPQPGPFTTYTKANPVSPKSKIPVQFWNIGDRDNPNDDKRLYVKVFESSQSGKKDSLWNATIINKDLVLKDSIQYEELFFMKPISPDTIYTEPIPNPSRPSSILDYPIGALTLMVKSPADFPKSGTVVRIFTWKPMKGNEEFEFVASKPIINDIAVGKKNIDNIGVFPNPYFGAHELERDKYQRFVRFTNLPAQVSIRIFSLAGVFITRVDKNDATTFADWDLRNIDGLPVASGVYIAHLEMPGIGAKVLKIAVIMETQYIDRL